MRLRILLATAALIATVSNSYSAVDHSIFDSVLKDHVHSGIVDYEAISKDSRLDTYLEELAHAYLDDIDKKEDRLALFINAYNAYTLKLIASAYPVRSIRLISDLGKQAESKEEAMPWQIRFANVGGTTYSLDEIENKVLRKEFNDPRIHFAIVCAARSCPILRSEAYVGDRIQEQLDAQGRWFFSWRNTFELETKEARLSKILEWFRDDFGGSEEAVLNFSIPYVNRQTAESLRAEAKQWTVNYLTYNWDLNGKQGTP